MPLTLSERNRLGGLSRAKMLSPQVRKDIASKASKARWLEYSARKLKENPIKDLDMCINCKRPYYKHQNSKDSICVSFSRAS